MFSLRTIILMGVSLLGAVSALAQEPLLRRGHLGITVSSPKDPRQKGAQVFNIETGSSAYESQVRAGDVITDINGKKIETPDDFIKVIDRPRSGQSIALKIKRADQTLDITVKIREAPAEASTDKVVVVYDWLKRDDGTQLRIVKTHPSQSQGNWPTVVIIPGLGGIACDDSKFTLYSQLAQEFTRQGYGVVRYDSRGSGDSYGGPYAAVDFQTEVADAAAVIAAVRKYPEVDPARLYVFGYSMGGVTATNVLTLEPNVSGLILWGSVSRPLVEFSIESVRRQSSLAGIAAPEINRQVRLMIRFYERMLSGEDPQKIVTSTPPLREFVSPEGYVQGKVADYWRQLDSTLYDKSYGEGKVPTLAIIGECDFMASPIDQDNIVALAQAGGRGEVHSVLVPGCDHYMNKVQSQKESMEKIRKNEYEFSPVAVEAATQWIHKLEAWRAGGSPQPMPKD